MAAQSELHTLAGAAQVRAVIEQTVSAVESSRGKRWEQTSSVWGWFE